MRQRRALEVSCASGEERSEDDKREIKERNWTREGGRVGPWCRRRKGEIRSSSQFEA